MGKRWHKTGPNGHCGEEAWENDCRDCGGRGWKAGTLTPQTCWTCEGSGKVCDNCGKPFQKG